jgi:hypothetical protein
MDRARPALQLSPRQNPWGRARTSRLRHVCGAAVSRAGEDVECALFLPCERPEEATIGMHALYHLSFAIGIPFTSSSRAMYTPMPRLFTDAPRHLRLNHVNDMVHAYR